ncbi:hypothetical protein BU25DRAFT_444301 [Macroventuria anomochaeta]|uniref:Uncharacterized protein n=1 Tax=Macroventuria anomochaeta TaxID=301207 RepID=A0ACB6SJX4_9PLEO|nr:uncharacterized protein BU25DRAFT_444301 [Macroventuria anomochaeta]KAF2633607.1 hypothetical protein BU25DRAFT_444301 [Macroventuria anomochaeta]
MSLFFNLISTTYGWSLLLLGAATLTLIASSAGKYFKKAPRSLRLPVKRRDPAVSGENLEDAYYNIEPLNDFDVDAEEPIKARPFKPKFHMTMAIKNTTLSDLVAMDKTYHSRIQIRRKLLTTEHHEVLDANPKAFPAVFELYKWLSQTYLPRRFPTMFTSTPTGLLNKTTNETLPLIPSSAADALELMGSHIDDEFFFLLPSGQPEDEGKYRLEAFITCFPSGFNTRSKLGLLLADIHTPVPHYKQKLKRSMDKFFASLPVGKIVKRWNWTISTSGELFCVKGNHTTEEELEEQGKEEIDLKTTFLRCERQTLHRLPESRAVVFAFKTYQYPIRELRDEGSGEALVEAIDGMGTGSAPEMTVYKRQVVWGEKIKAFLRGEIEDDQ